MWGFVKYRNIIFKLMETNLFSELLDVVTILDEYTYILSATQYEYNVVLRIIQSWELRETWDSTETDLREKDEELSAGLRKCVCT